MCCLLTLFSIGHMNERNFCWALEGLGLYFLWKTKCWAVETASTRWFLLYKCLRSWLLTPVILELKYDWALKSSSPVVIAKVRKGSSMWIQEICTCEESKYDNVLFFYHFTFSKYFSLCILFESESFTVATPCRVHSVVSAYPIRIRRISISYVHYTSYIHYSKD